MKKSTFTFKGKTLVAKKMPDNVDPFFNKGIEYQSKGLKKKTYLAFSHTLFFHFFGRRIKSISTRE